MKMLRIWGLTALLSFVGNQIQATEMQPWLGNFGEFEWRNTFLYQGYPAISSGSHIKKYSANSLFLTTSLSAALSEFALEVEATQASTRQQSGGIDNLKATARYLWQDDIAGDPISFVTGLSLDHAFSSALKDVSSFHHGRAEAELFVSVGKERPDEMIWQSRWWALAAIGVADGGSPWLRFNFNYEKRWNQRHEVQSFLNTLWGLGHKRLHLHAFHGYGPVQHQSVDLGLRYTYLIDYFGSASIEYSYRVYARNFPVYTHRVLAQLLYTFGL